VKNCVIDLTAQSHLGTAVYTAASEITARTDRQADWQRAARFICPPSPATTFRRAVVLNGNRREIASDTNYSTRAVYIHGDAENASKDNSGKNMRKGTEQRLRIADFTCCGDESIQNIAHALTTAVHHY